MWTLSGISIAVHDLELSEYFYGKVLGLGAPKERNNAKDKKNKTSECISVTEAFLTKLLTSITMQIAMAIVTSGNIDPIILKVISLLL